MYWLDYITPIATAITAFVVIVYFINYLRSDPFIFEIYFKEPSKRDPDRELCYKLTNCTNYSLGFKIKITYVINNIKHKTVEWDISLNPNSSIEQFMDNTFNMRRNIPISWDDFNEDSYLKFSANVSMKNNRISICKLTKSMKSEWACVKKVSEFIRLK